MKFIRRQTVARERMIGTWCNLGSSLTAEMAGSAGFDWVLLDMEHGTGDFGNLVHQLQALESTPSAPVVRIPWNDAVWIKRVLDIGAAGVMVPYVNTATEAQQAARAMRYPPSGTRGAARMTRATTFGVTFPDYFQRANDELLTIVQLETQEAVENAAEIARVDGVDVLFVGPLDLSVNLGAAEQLDTPVFRAAIQRVVTACRDAGKAAGILAFTPAHAEQSFADGFTFVALGSDGGMVASGMRNNAALLRKLAM